MASEIDSGKRIMAVVGKGGVGKTAITAMTSRILVESKQAGNMLVIDADPAMGLLTALGIKVKRTMGQVREDIIRGVAGADSKQKEKLVNTLDYMAFEAMDELDDYAILAMGRTETLGCYCPVNDLLRGTIEVLSKSFDTILIDGEAGLEQLNRQVMRRISTLIIISDATARGVETAEMIKGMVENDKVIRCERMGVIFNRVSGNEDILISAAERIGLELFGIIPQDEQIAYYDLMAKPVIELPSESPGFSALHDIVLNNIKIGASNPK